VSWVVVAVTASRACATLSATTATVITAVSGRSWRVTGGAVVRPGAEPAGGCGCTDPTRSTAADFATARGSGGVLDEAIVKPLLLLTVLAADDVDVLTW
jgi:hypothetical protein